ncbi:MAG: polyisoprenyl-teichoic acid--peptidoglycan teichoic acid transferase, partial [Gaiellales bacterium]|nr:polyisoprenyl-teichoic acid--peptidoglycan teichoic acid transferase [Gaiellales bacterium]
MPPVPGDDAKRPFRTYRGRGDDAEDPIEQRARAGAAGESPASAEAPSELPDAPAEGTKGQPRVTPPRAAPAARGRPGVVILPDQPPQPPAPGRPPGPPGGPPTGPTRRPPRRPPRGPRRRRRWGRVITLTMLGLLLLVAIWIGYGYWQYRGSLAGANKRIDAQTRAALVPGGSLLSDPSTTLVLGSDRRSTTGPGRSDSILLVRVDPARNRIAELSIPRDLRVTIPGHGDDRINVAYALGGPALAIRTVQALTGIPINHVVLVDFSGFRDLVDALGGVTIDNPEKVISNSFDGHPWRFGRGRLHLDGRHALAYARVRENTANPSDNDLTRGLRQQRVLQSIAHGLASPETLFHLPSVGRSIGRPLATDLSANDILELGWRQMRVGATLHCHLGGTITSVGGASELIGGDENRRVILAVLGTSAPVAAAPGDTF